MPSYKNTKDNDEYQFPPEEYVGGDEEYKETEDFHTDDDDRHARAAQGEEEFANEEGEDIGAPSVLQSLKDKLAAKKRVIVAVVLALVVLAGFAYMHLHSNKEAVASLGSAAPVVRPTVTPSAPSADIQQTVEMNNHIAALKQATADNQQSMGQMQNKLNTLEDTLNQIQADQKQLDDNMRQLQMELGGLAQKATQAQTQPAVVKAVPPPPAPSKVFYLRAVVPGRAWIVDDQNTSHSIAVGDPVKDYGVVTKIDADNAIVLTSSGRPIVVKSDENN